MLIAAPRVALSWLIPQDGNVARVTGLWRVHGESLQLIRTDLVGLVWSLAEAFYSQNAFRE